MALCLICCWPSIFWHVKFLHGIYQKSTFFPYVVEKKSVQTGVAIENFCKKSVRSFFSESFSAANQAQTWHCQRNCREAWNSISLLRNACFQTYYAKWPLCQAVLCQMTYHHGFNYVDLVHKVKNKQTTLPRQACFDLSKQC